MDAGTVLDALVAEQVMGQRRVGDCPLGASDCIGKYEPQIGRWPCLAPYSTDIAAAWEVVEAMVGKGCEFALIADERCEPRDYAAEFSRNNSNIGETTYLCGERADTAPHAICLAALRAVGVEP